MSRRRVSFEFTVSVSAVVEDGQWTGDPAVPGGVQALPDDIAEAYVSVAGRDAARWFSEDGNDALDAMILSAAPLEVFREV